jgi:hypothetical protein
MLFVGAYLWIAFQVASSRPLLSLYGILFTLAGLPFFYLWPQKRTGQAEYDNHALLPENIPEH